MVTDVSKITANKSGTPIGSPGPFGWSSRDIAKSGPEPIVTLKMRLMRRLMVRA